MDTRFPVFVFGILAVTAVFLTGVFTSPVAFGLGACWVVTSTVNYCTTSSDQKWYVCVLDKKTGTRPCKEMTFSGPPDSPPDNLPPALQNSLDAAIAEAKDTKKVPESALNDGGLLKGQGDNQTTSKTIVGPQDRFCVEGTGGDTGSPCLPCDPGLKFEVGCIDVTTGGPLDMPDAATSESGENDDTNPKDLDGSNNDDNGPNVNPGSD